MHGPVIDVSLVSPSDSGYRAQQHAMAALRPAYRRGRSAGEVLGHQVERAARRWLQERIPLQEERILRWSQIDRSGRYGARYREIDAVRPIGERALCLFEIKLTGAKKMRSGEGLRQLRDSIKVLAEDRRYRRLCRRLVYVSDCPLPVANGLPVVDPDDTDENIGVIWISPEALQDSAHALRIALPGNWLDPAARQGMEAEEEDWRRFAGAGSRLTHSFAEAFSRALPV